MRIAMVSEHASPLAVLGEVDAGGQNVHVAQLATALARSGNRVTVYTRRDDAAVPERCPLVDGVEVVHVDAGPPEHVPKDDLLPYMGALAGGIARDLPRVGAAIIHAHFWMSGVAALGAARVARVPTAITYHALGSVKQRQQGVKDTSPPQRLRIERVLARSVDRVLATSNEEMFELARMGARPGTVALVPCGVDTTEFRPEGKCDPLPRRERYRIVVVSRLVERKGIGNVVEALVGVPLAELVIAGGPAAAQLADDPEARRLREIADAFGVGDRVQFLGGIERARVPALLRSADVAVCTPWYEPFGLVALEAMACGVPVVASAVGGLVDTVIDGVTGVHVPPRDVPALAGALRDVLADDHGRRRLGRAAALRASTRYDWSTIAAETRLSYHHMLPEPRRIERVG